MMWLLHTFFLPESQSLKCQSQVYLIDFSNYGPGLYLEKRGDRRPVPETFRLGLE